MSRQVMLLAMLLCLLACAKKERSYHDDGKLDEVYEVDDTGERNGKYKRYYKNGNLAEEATYIAGKQDGERKLYYESGKLEEVQRFEKGKLNGPQKGYHENGALKFECTNVDNLLQGEYNSYYDNGKKRLLLNFVDDLENGPFEEYYRSGIVQWKGTYRNGNKAYGLLEEFDEGGVVITKKNCDTIGACYTIWKKGDIDEK